MSLATIHTRALDGVDSPAVRVEVDLANGLPGISIVGLPEAAVKESKDRVRAAIKNANFEFPARRITVSLAPADLPKEGGRFDLPIALGILAASGQIPAKGLDQIECLGELSLAGELRPVRGVLPAAMAASKSQHQLILPQSNAAEAALISAADVRPAQHLLDVCEHLTNNFSAIEPYTHIPNASEVDYQMDLAEVLGQPHARRALEI